MEGELSRKRDTFPELPAFLQLLTQKLQFFIMPAERQFRLRLANPFLDVLVGVWA